MLEKIYRHSSITSLSSKTVPLVPLRLLPKLILRYHAKIALLCFNNGDASLSVCLCLCSRAIEHFCDLFETSALGFREQESHDSNKRDQAADIEEVVAPRQSRQRNWIEVLVEHASSKDRSEHTRHSA
jgi:hypothetical protein